MEIWKASSPLLYVEQPGFREHTEAPRDVVSPVKDIHSNIIARRDFYAEPHLHMHHTLAFISALH